MLGAIKDAILGLFETLTSIYEFLGFFLRSFIDFFDKLLEAIENLPIWYSFMPAFIVSSVIALVGLILVIRIVGR